MTKTMFIQLIEMMQSTSKFLDNACDLNIGLYDIEPIQTLYKLENIIYNSEFEQEAIDTIYWWLYEYEDKSRPAMWDKDGKDIPITTVEDLWNFVKNYMKK